jgi:hypothetical protein
MAPYCHRYTVQPSQLSCRWVKLTILQGISNGLPLVMLLRRWLQGNEGKAVWVAQPTDETIRSVETAHCCCGIRTISESDFVQYLTCLSYQSHTGESPIFGDGYSPTLGYYFVVSLGWTLVLIFQHLSYTSFLFGILDLRALRSSLSAMERWINSSFFGSALI